MMCRAKERRTPRQVVYDNMSATQRHCVS